MNDLPQSAKIVVLAQDVANQIAAGEVVERPASVVKELVENSLDAHARTLTVSIDGGGVARIAVTDDGVGMSHDDLALSVVRHATSKIRSADDLLGVATYGFRGEALASVGSVARLILTSRPRDAEEGCEVRLDGNATPVIRSVGCAYGTTVSVEDLFFNTPARRKFLRTPQTEWATCADVVARLALPRPDVRFVLRKDGKTVREYLRRDTIGDRVRELWSDETLAEIDGRRGGIRVQAFLGPPERARSGSSGISIYVNGRFVRDKLLLRAVAQAYGSTLESGRYPPGAVLIEVAPTQVDVNVHPQKAEVRFAQQNDVFSAVVSLLREGLSSAPWARSIVSGPAHTSTDDGWNTHFTGGPSSAPTTDHPPQPPSRPYSLASAGPTIAQPLWPSTAKSFATGAPETEQPSLLDPWGLKPTDDPSAKTETIELASPNAAPYNSTEYAPVRTPPLSEDTGLPERTTFSSLHFVAQVRRMFFVCECDWGMVMLDQHAAAERVVYDRLRRAYANREVRVQPLLVHETLEGTAREVALAEEYADQLAQIGFELTPMGSTTVAIRAVPALLVRADPRRLARDVLAELARHGNDFSRAYELVLATMACHGSLRGGEEVAPEEARALLSSLDDCDFGGHCPHGRPVLWSMRWAELERKVGR